MPAPDYHNYDRKVERAARRVDTEPTLAQREALNYRQGTVHVHGLTIAIENPKGSVRRGVGPDGKPWARTMVAHYGRIKRTVGRDGEPVDVFLGPDPDSQLVFVIDQLESSGDLGEHKVMLGCRNYPKARQLYLTHYPPNWARTNLGAIRGMTMPQFRRWLDSEAPVKKRKPIKSAAETWSGINEIMAITRAVYLVV
jgi:hypothetical protein